MRITALLALTVALSAGGLGAAAPAAATPTVPCPGVCLTPPPTGPLAVGRTTLPSTGEQLGAITAWYPAERRTGADARLLSPTTAAGLSEHFGMPDLSRIGTYARQDARVSRGPLRPVVLLAPGYGLVSELYGSTAEDLASHGYIVVGVDPLPEDPDTEPTAAQLTVRIQSLKSVLIGLREVDHPLTDVADARRVGVIGHSFGGAAAVNLVGTGGVRSAVNLDGSVFGPVVEAGAAGPTLLLSSLPCLDPTQAALAGSTAAGRLTARQLVGSTHYTFTDLVHFGGDAGGTLPAAQAADVQRDVLRRWLSDTVRTPRKAPARVSSTAPVVPVTAPCAA